MKKLLGRSDGTPILRKWFLVGGWTGTGMRAGQLGRRTGGWGDRSGWVGWVVGEGWGGGVGHLWASSLHLNGIFSRTTSGEVRLGKLGNPMNVV